MRGVCEGAAAQARAEDAVLFELSRGMARGRLALGEAAARFAEQEGAGAFGFSNRDAYAKEQLSRRGRWVDDCARLATRLEGLPRIDAAYREGRLRPSMAELLARKADAESEAELLELALSPEVTVHAMRDYLRCDEPEEEDPSDRCRLDETLPSEDALLVEATRMLIEHLDGSDYDWFGALVGEGFSTWPALFDGTILPDVFFELDDASERIAAGVEQAREVEELAEPGLPESGVEPGEFPEEPLPSDVWGLDSVMRRTALRLSSRDLVFGRAARDFFRASKWKLLGYATERQYCDERLGMGRTAVRDRIKLARACERLPLLAEAVATMSVGFESALLLTRVATPRTEEAWIERAQRRTYKLLRQEVRAVETAQRLSPGIGGDPWPPTDQEMSKHERFERSVLSGEIAEELFAEKEKAVGAAEIRIEPQAEASDSPDAKPARSGSPRAPWFDADIRELASRIAATARERRRRKKGDVTLHIRGHRRDITAYRAARTRYARLGKKLPLIVSMCRWLWETWIHELREALSKWDGVHERDRYCCASPGCFRRLCTLHHILRRLLGGDDRWENLLTLCDVCHLRNVHERGSLQVFGEAPDGLTFVFGVEPVFVVRGREKRPAA